MTKPTAGRFRRAGCSERPPFLHGVPMSAGHGRGTHCGLIGAPTFIQGVKRSGAPQDCSLVDIGGILALDSGNGFVYSGVFCGVNIEDIGV